MTNYREILRLNSLGLNNSQIAEACGCSRTTVVQTLRLAKDKSLTYPLPKEMSDKELAETLFPPPPGKIKYKMPDYEYVYREMQKKGVTLNLLWLEYCDKCRNSGEVPYQSTQFNKYYGDFLVKKNATMHLNHKPGEIMQVDWAGDTASIIDTDTGNTIPAYVFVATLPYRRPRQILCKKNKALPIRQDLKQRKNLKGSDFIMEKTSKELLKEFVNSQQFTSTTDIMNSMKELFSDVLQTVMEAELEEKLGYEKSERVSNTGEENMSKNYRNGYSKKTVKTQLGEVDVKIPRDRNGDYSPQIIEKYNRNADGMEEKILALYACGMSQSDISEQIKNLYDVDISDGLVSKIVDKITPDVTAWQNRPLDAVYPFVFMDAIHYKVKENHQYITKAAYVVLGIQADGRKDILGVWIGENESAKFWLSVMNDLKNRGIKDVYVFCVDGLIGFREAINAAFPKSQIQRCIIHQIRSSTRYVSCKDIKSLMSDLKKVYQAINEDEALNALMEFKEKWQKSYPSCVRSWEENWDILSTFFAYPAEVRKIIYTTNIIEGLNRQFRKITKNKPSFTNDDSLRKILYLASKNIVSHWSVTCRNWDVVSDQLSIMFADRRST